MKPNKATPVQVELIKSALKNAAKQALQEMGQESLKLTVGNGHRLADYERDIEVKSAA